MANIVNHQGRLFASTRMVSGDVSDYELVEDAPQLKYSRYLDEEFAITEPDGLLYDVYNKQLLDINRGGFVQVASDLNGNICALDTNGNLFHYNTIRPNSELLLIQEDVDFLSGHSTTIFYISDRTFYIMEHGEEIRRYQIPDEFGHIVDLFQRIIITESHFICFDGNGRYGFGREGNLIGAGVITTYPDARETYGLIIVEEVDGYLKTTEQSIDRHGEYLDRYGGAYELSNQFLDDIHQQSPWIEMVQIEKDSYLLNQDGRLAMMTPFCGFTSSAVPSYIFRTTRMKNPRTRI